MWGLFIAIGPGIAARTLQLVDNVDVDPLLCRLLGVLPETNHASNALADALSFGDGCCKKVVRLTEARATNGMAARALSRRVQAPRFGRIGFILRCLPFVR